MIRVTRNAARFTRFTKLNISYRIIGIVTIAKCSWILKTNDHGITYTWYYLVFMQLSRNKYTLTGLNIVSSLVLFASQNTLEYCERVILALHVALVLVQVSKNEYSLIKIFRCLLPLSLSSLFSFFTSLFSSLFYSLLFSSPFSSPHVPA